MRANQKTTIRCACLLIVAMPLVASCDDDDQYNRAYTPFEVNKGLVAGNFSGDGHTSIVTTSTVLYGGAYNAGNLKAFYSVDGGTAFSAAVLTSDGNDPLYLAAADLNGDGLPDVVSASYIDGSLNVFFNTPPTAGSVSSPSFETPVTLNSPGASQVAIGDMNGDGLPDLVSADFNVSLFVQSAPGVFAAPVNLYAGGANWVALGDLNHDGSLDVALTDAVGVKVLLHTGAASSTTYAAPVAVFTQTSNEFVQGANIVAIADVNGDGFQDLIITDPGPSSGSTPTVNVLLQNAAQPGTFLAAAAYATPAQNLALSIVVTDLNGDGHPDIVIGGTNQVTVLLQDPASPGTFLAANSYATPGPSSEIAVADVNGDGLPDIVVNVGPTQSSVNGTVVNPTPGVLFQSASAPGTFGAVAGPGTILAP